VNVVKKINNLKQVNLIFPNQLFLNNPLFNNDGIYYLIEEHLFFNQFNFHLQKLIYHRSTMKYYFDFLKNQGKEVVYIDESDKNSDVRNLIPFLKAKGFNKINYIISVDNYLDRRISNNLEIAKIEFDRHESPMFINSTEDLKKFFTSTKKKFYHTSFYIEQRKKLNVLLDSNGGAEGGKWSFDTDNRKKYPKEKQIPKLLKIKSDDYFEEAKEYVINNFSDNPGLILEKPIYPSTHKDAKKWLLNFIKEKLEDFGPYEDAIVANESFLNHSILSPLINSGLITPLEVINEILKSKNNYPLNSIEGFIRQIIGWREFIRGVYVVKGSQERTTNYFSFKRKIPDSFYNASTGIPPIDDCINKALKTSYNHHIERLMVLGNFMLLCEFDPDEVYRWFMEMYIDAYDWVMVPNVYGMSQFADGGLMSTKPYISSSNYLIKMSDYKKGDWQKIWDGLYWRFISNQRGLFEKNIRMKFMVSILDKMSNEKRQEHFTNAENYLKTLQ
jgi:deoxyribodipyrimidine photolyase-related protein